MNDLLNDPAAFIFAPFNPALLDAEFIASRVQAGVAPEEWAHSDLVAARISKGAAVFTAASDLISYPQITLQQTGDQLALRCSCPTALPDALCAHQARALYTLAYHDELRFFFDP
ncbi:MAG TPA: hypothetical protein VGC22_03125, partial [Chitinophaga sp.]